VDDDAILFGCGNGVVEPELGEVCDDGNAVREACRTTDPTACLADCSAAMSTCPSGAANPGEQCDDGNTDTMDTCTTSCTVNIQSIGSPCQCTSGCDTLDFTAGTIVGCDLAVPYEDENRTLACLRSSRDSTHGVAVYGASGFCTLLAVGCRGTFCYMVPTTGNVDLFTCPAGSAVLTEVRVMMGMTITARSCHPLCWTDADCRWNAVEDGSSPWSGSCGAYECLPLGAGGQNICVDPRNSP
jgi:cysteine-rich repeat protein